MRPIVRSLAAVVVVALFVPAATSPAFAQNASATPSVEPSGSPRPDARVALAPSTEMIPFRTWTIAATGGTPSVDVLEVDDSGSAFDVTVSGESATVELTLTLPAEHVMRASCFDFDNQVEIGHVEPPRQFVFDVVPGGLYDCEYDTECAGPSSPPYAGVAVSAPTPDFAVSEPWPISVAGGRALGSDGLCGTSPISSLRLVQDPDIPGALLGAFSVEVFGESAAVEITAPRPKGGSALVVAECGEQNDEGRLHDVLVLPRRLVFDVVPLGFYDCFVQGRQGTVPPTDTQAGGAPADSSTGLTGVILVVLIGVLSGSLFLATRSWRIGLLPRRCKE